MVAPLSSWPWENLGSLKYLLYGPLVAKALHSWAYEDGQRYSWCLHILIICALRGLIYQLWHSYSSMLFLTRNRMVNKQGVGYKQIDEEWDWDNFLILHAFMAAMACYAFQFLGTLQIWNWSGCVYALLLHIGVSEPLYYWVHRRLHVGSLFTDYHSLHHSSVVTQPYTAGNATLLEQLILGVIMGIPILGPCLIGAGSVCLIYGYVLIFDFLRGMGHSNVEVIPNSLFEFFPFLRLLLHTPTYHSLHHMETSTNFCLFMPLFDKLGNTLDNRSWELHKKTSSGACKLFYHGYQHLGVTHPSKQTIDGFKYKLFWI